MIKIVASVEFSGSNFIPRLAEEEGSFLFSNKNEVGDIGRAGIYQYKPVPFGSAMLSPPLTIVHYERILWLAKFLEDKIAIIRKYKAKDIYFEIGYFYDGQCNCELTVDEIKAIARLQIPISFSTYRVENLDAIF